MEWISVEDELPKPFEIVWIFWRDKEVLLGCRTYEGAEEKECPPSEGWYSFSDEKCRWTHYWQRTTRANILDTPRKPTPSMEL
jgi:hypothetical protein